MNVRIAPALAGVWQIRRDHENVARMDCLYPYQEPTQVTLAEKAKACQVTPVQGIRQISLVSSV